MCCFGSGNDFNKMHLWQNLGAGQNGKTQEVCINGNSHNVTSAILVLPNEESLLGNEFLLERISYLSTSLDIFS